jgi:hypothetical protein
MQEHCYIKIWPDVAQNPTKMIKIEVHNDQLEYYLIQNC